LSRERETNSYTENLEAKAQSHRFLIGKNGSTIRKVHLKLADYKNLVGVSIFFAELFANWL